MEKVFKVVFYARLRRIDLADPPHWSKMSTALSLDRIDYGGWPTDLNNSWHQIFHGPNMNVYFMAPNPNITYGYSYDINDSHRVLLFFLLLTDMN